MNGRALLVPERCWLCSLRVLDFCTGMPRERRRCALLALPVAVVLFMFSWRAQHHAERCTDEAGCDSSGHPAAEVNAWASSSQPGTTVAPVSAQKRSASLPPLPYSLQQYSNSTDGVEDYAYQHFFFGVENGSFVEVGAFDGVTGSHSLALERQLGWRGVLIEASLISYLQLQAARRTQVRGGCVQARVAGTGASL